jgi:hypothetical protein
LKDKKRSPNIKFGLTFSHNGISSSSKRSRGSFPIKISQPLSGGAASQPGGGPPYFLCPFSCKSRVGLGGREENDKIFSLISLIISENHFIIMNILRNTAVD